MTYENVLRAAHVLNWAQFHSAAQAQKVAQQNKILLTRIILVAENVKGVFSALAALMKLGPGLSPFVSLHTSRSLPPCLKNRTPNLRLFANNILEAKLISVLAECMPISMEVTQFDYTPSCRTWIHSTITQVLLLLLLLWLYCCCRCVFSFAL